MINATPHVYLVGAGPGDPDLLTVKALRVLRQAEVILYDRLVSAEILALAPETAEFIYTGKEEGHQEEVQREIFRLLLERAETGRRVVRLKGGDPFVFGRGGEEVLFLRRHGIETEVVPGISSSIAGPASAGIPVTYRGIARSFTVVSARCKGGEEADWARLAGADTLIVLMGVKYRERIASALIQAGRPKDQPVAFIERASTPEQRVVEGTLEDTASGRLEVEAPAVFVIGEVAKLRHNLAEFTAAFDVAGVA